MSTDYSKMSDFEINSAVHNALMQEPYKIEFLGNDKIRWVRGSTDVTTGKVAYGKNSLKDYCNNPADAWPIIQDYRVGVIPAPCAGEWKAAHRAIGDDDTPHYFSQHTNPLRAAMMVFLKMQESKNAS